MSCHISKKVRGECDKCGNIPAALHMPEYVHGWYCAACCPVCRVSRQPVKPAAEKQPALQAA